MTSVASPAGVPTRPPPISEADVNNVEDFVKEIRQSIVSVVDGSKSPEIWSPEADFPFRRHLARLRIPLLKGKPCLLLHNLGSPRKGKTLQNRLEHVFMPNSHT